MQNVTRLALENRFHGLMDKRDADQLPPGYFGKIDNAFCSDGQITKVPGSSSIAASIAAQPFNGFSDFEIISSSSKYLIASINGASNAQLYTWNGSGNFSPIGSANLTNSKPVWFTTANNILWGFNGSEVVDVASDGSTVTVNRTGVPIGNYAEWFHNYLFVAKTTANPNRLFWSNLGDPTTFNASNFVDVNPGDSDQIMGVAPFQDELLVFKRNTIWSITGFSGSTFSASTIATQNTNGRIFGYGTVAPLSIVPIGNDVFFLSMLGNVPVIRSLRKTINAVTLGGGVISDAISGTMETITFANLSQIVGTFDGRYVYWSIPTNASATNNQIIVLDTWEIVTSKGATVYPFITMSSKNASYFAVSTIPGYSTIYFTDASLTSGLVFKFNTSVHTDNGVPIVMTVQTRDYSSAVSRKTKYKYLYLTFTSGTAGSIVLSSRVDEGSHYTTQDTISLQGNSPPLGSFVLGSSTLGGQTITTHRTALAQLLCHYLGLQLIEATANPVTIHNWELWGVPKQLRAN